MFDVDNNRISELVLKDAKILWDYHCRMDSINQLVGKTDARIIIGLGSYDLRVADYCAFLYQQKIANKVLFTGKSGNWTQGRWEKTEAEIFAYEAEKLGVPNQDILTEKKATNIGENIRFAKTLLEKSNLFIQQVILVTKPNTTRRAFATFMMHWPDMPVILSAPAINFNMWVEEKNIADLINELVGDIQRILIYPEKNFQIKQEVPHKVLDAYGRLIKLGYTAHMK